jgi:hypothetical protein
VKEAFLEFASKKVTMTTEDLAAILRVSPEYLRKNSKPPHGFIPRVPLIRAVRFCPLKMIEVFCQEKAERPSSLKIERRKTGEKPKGGYRKCL